MRYILVMILVWLFIKQTSAQSVGTINLLLQSESNADIYYNAILKNAGDSSIIKIENAKPSVPIEFSSIPYADYFIQVYFMSKVVAEVKLFSLQTSQLDLGKIAVQQIANEIKEVKIAAQKNIVERKLDKLIYNVDATITSPADDAITVLQKSPGISVDNNGNISMRGKNGVQVMINGKLTYVQGEQLNSLLKSTMASQISKIEIITNPSSKYDANGNAGLVNIILKKDMRRGTNGTATLSYGKGFYRKSNNSLSLNHRSSQLNIFGSYNFINNIGFNDLRLYRQFYTNGKYEGAYQQHNYIVFPFYNHILRAGCDLNLSQKTTIGIAASGIINKFNPAGENKTYIEDSNLLRQSYYTTENRSRDLWYNFGANINLKHVFDSTGRELTADADYVQFGNTTTQNFTTRYYDLQDNENKQPYLLLGKIKGLLDIKAIKADYVHPLKNNMKVEAGFKSS